QAMGGGGSKPAQKVLIAVDGSQHSQQAFDWYRSNMASPNDEVILFHSACLPAYLAGPTGVPASPIDVERAAESLRRRVSNLESSMLGQCQKHNMRCRWRFADAFDAGAAVVNAAADESVNMVVMGTRGLGTIRRTILGSVSEFVISHSRRPVVVVPPRGD
ncbi:hypothetical protein BOX15_Mlig030784g1, partial [Macrostomum lignano]